MKPQIDYSKNINIPDEYSPHMEWHYTALRVAKKVIRILSTLTDSVTTFSYKIQHGKPDDMILPSLYHFDWFDIKFLPGWWNYIIVLPDGVELSFKKPHSEKELQEDLEKIRSFIQEYTKLPLYEKAPEIPRRLYEIGRNPLIHHISKRQSAVIEFRNTMRELKRMV